MRIVVIGAGGIGGLYGGLLARAGFDVSFLARGAHLHAIRDRGLEIRSADFGTFTVQSQASDHARDLGQADLVLFAVKTYDLESAAEATRQVLTPEASVLTFQNGVDAPDQLAAMVGAGHVLIGTTRLETTVLEPGVIGHLSPGHHVSVAALDGPPTPQVEHTADVLRQASINVSVEEDGRLALWQKAGMLIPMATLTSVCRAAIGPIRDLPETRALAEQLFAETRAVARACGYDLVSGQTPGANTLDRTPPTMKASMARDFERGGPTELEALTGALVRLADAHGVDVPASRTAYAILKFRAGLEAGEPSRVSAAVAGR